MPFPSVPPLPGREAAGLPASWFRTRLGRADDMQAEVWLQCDPAALPDGADGPCRLEGTITGPRCSVAATLPTTSRFVDQGAAAGLPTLARAVCTEPGYWTPELPNLYRVEATVRRGAEMVATAVRTVGLRRAGVRGGSIWLDGRRYVPRGVVPRGGETLAAWRALAAVAILEETQAGGTLSPLADELGVGVVVRARCPGADGVAGLAARIEEWSGHPSTLVVTLPADAGRDTIAEVAVATRRRRGTTLLGIEADGGLPPPPVPEGIDLVVALLRTGGVPHDGWRDPPPVPVVAGETAAAGPGTPGERRSACDSLQARLAAWGERAGGRMARDWAGYFVL